MPDLGAYTDPLLLVIVVVFSVAAGLTIPCLILTGYLVMRERWKNR